MSLRLRATHLLAGIGLLTLAGCHTTGDYVKEDANHFVTEFYAWVDAVDPVTFDSDMDQNVVIGATSGAISGAIDNDGRAFEGAILGGVVAAVLTAIAEGDNTGYEYQLSAVDGDRVTVLSDNQSALLGDCVMVRVAKTVTLYPVAAEQCVSDVM